MPIDSSQSSLNGSSLNRLRVGDAGKEGSDEVDELVPSWVPDGRVHHRERWLTAIRADPGRAGGIVLAIIAAIAVLVTLFTVVDDGAAPVVSAKLPPVEMVSSSAARPSAGPAPDQQAPDQQAVVSVVGLVHQPGLVTLAPQSRIADAVSAAGGALDGADLIGLNLAGHITDGQQIVVGVATPAGQPSALGSSVTTGSGQAAGPSSAPADPTPPGPVDLNTATVEQLDELPGVGPVTANAIVDWRSTHGKFASVDQLGEVDGIGPARLEKLRALVRV